MLDLAESSALGRCPACGRLVTVPVSARSSEVACPVCRHRARGAAFSAEEPLPVIVVDQRAESASRPAPKNGFERATMPRIDASGDDARTHLLLDVPMDDEEQGATPSAAVGVRLRNSDAAGDARTHLLLDPSDLKDDEAAPESAAARRPPRAGAKPPAKTPSPSALEEGKTRLQVGPLSLRTEEKVRGTAVLAWLIPGALRLSVWLDEALHGREVWAHVALAFIAGGVAPTIDYLWSGGRSTLGAFTWAAVLVGFGALVLARVNGLRSDEGKWDPTLAVTRIRTSVGLLIEGAEQLARSPLHVKLATFARALVWAGMSLLVWAGLLGGVRLLFGVPSATTGLPFVGGVLLLIAAGMDLYAARVAPRVSFSLEEAGDSLAAAAELPPVIDLSAPLTERFSMPTTRLHEAIVALSSFRPRLCSDEASYRAGLARHLERALPGYKVESDRWVGRSRRDGVIDLVIDGVVVIGVKRGFHEATAERAVAQITGYARSWSGKPMLLVIFDAPGAALMEGPHAKALAALHDELAVVTLRMR